MEGQDVQAPVVKDEVAGPCSRLGQDFVESLVNQLHDGGAPLLLPRLAWQPLRQLQGSIGFVTVPENTHAQIGWTWI